MSGLKGGNDNKSIHKNVLRKCLMCGKEYLYEPSDEKLRKAFPFCSAECKLADLDKWLTEDYRISRPIHPDDIEEEEKGDAQDN